MYSNIYQVELNSVKPCKQRVMTLILTNREPILDNRREYSISYKGTNNTSREKKRQNLQADSPIDGHQSWLTVPKVNNNILLKTTKFYGNSLSLSESKPITLSIRSCTKRKINTRENNRD
jgi:hypothetical protein